MPNVKLTLPHIHRREFVGSDPAVIRSYLDDVYRSHLRLTMLARARGGRPRLAHHRTQWDGFAVEDVEHDGAVEVRGDVNDGVIVLWTLRGRAESRLGDTAAVARPGEVILGSTGCAPVQVT